MILCHKRFPERTVVNAHDSHLTILILETAVMCSIMSIPSVLLKRKSDSRSLNLPFESGMVPTGKLGLYLDRKIYLLATIFLILDVEMLYVYAWAVDPRGGGWNGMLVVMSLVLCFTSVLLRMRKDDIFNLVR